MFIQTKFLIEAVSRGTDLRAACTERVSFIISWQSTKICPPVGFDRPLIILIVVVFPDPVGPSNQKSHQISQSERSFIAVKLPKRFVYNILGISVFVSFLCILCVVHI